MGFDQNEVGLPVGDELGTPKDPDGDGRTRRQLLAGAAGALSAVAVTSLLRAEPAGAATGDDLVIGTNNDADQGDPTTLFAQVWNSAEHPWGFGCLNVPGGVGSVGVYGTVTQPNSTNDDPTAMGVKGEANHGIGVWGQSNAGPGLRAQSSTSDGTFSSTGGSNKSGVYGENTGGQGYGVVGRSNASGKAAVWGDNTAGGTGVVGGTTGGGVGVHGQSQTGDGVQGLTGGTGASAVFGNNTSGGANAKGVFGAASGPGTGGLGSSGSIVRYSSRCPSGSVK